MKRTYAKSLGFTIVELLIVIVVIAILASLSYVVYNGIQGNVRKTAVASQETQVRKKLATYRAEHGTYPADQAAFDSIIGQSSGDGAYVTYYPSPVFDTYFVSATAATNLSLSCPDGFVEVPGSGSYNTNSFCLMKYEAKNVGGTPVSQPSGAPWVSISQTSAITASRDACKGCSLITEAQWMTVAMNALSVASNWSGGQVGSGTFPRGNSNGTSALEATSDLTGINKRALRLTNGEEVWDLAGNVWEWTQGTITGAQPGVSGQTAYAWRDYTDAGLQWGGLAIDSQPTGTKYARSVGVGGLYSNPGDAGARAFIRGGHWHNGSDAGVLTLLLFNSPSYTNTNFGFRVAR